MKGEEERREKKRVDERSGAEKRGKKKRKEERDHLMHRKNVLFNLATIKPSKVL